MASPFHKILVPHDGSEHATRALGLAADLASGSDGRLIVLRAIAPFLSFAELGAEEETPWIPPEEVVEKELEHLESIVRKALSGRAPTSVECRVVVGDAFSSILDGAREADLIVMATHGRTGLEHLVIGSVAEKVVRHAPVPVLTIGKEVPSPKTSSPSRRKATKAHRGRRR
jgi:nucleotide-binding universal stress UspA family protein